MNNNVCHVWAQDDQILWRKEKVYITPNYSGWITPPQTIESDFLPPELSKTSQITPPSSFWTVVLL
jgi:hypothetical protein